MQKSSPPKRAAWDDQQASCCRSSTNMPLGPLTVGPLNRVTARPYKRSQKIYMQCYIPATWQVHSTNRGDSVLPWLRSHKIPCLAVRSLQPWPSYFTSKKAIRTIKVAFHFPNAPLTSCKRNKQTINVTPATEFARTLASEWARTPRPSLP